MTILDSQPPPKLLIRLEFSKPFSASSLTTFTLEREAGATLVRWSMEGRNDFMGKVFSLVAGGMDSATGPDFERGLSQMKLAVENIWKTKI